MVSLPLCLFSSLLSNDQGTFLAQYPHALDSNSQDCISLKLQKVPEHAMLRQVPETTKQILGSFLITIE